MKIKKYKSSEKGFAIALALLMLLVMSLMGATLVMVAGSDHKKMLLKILINKHFMLQKQGSPKLKNGWKHNQVYSRTVIRIVI